MSQKSTAEFIQSPIKERKELKAKEVFKSPNATRTSEIWYQVQVRVRLDSPQDQRVGVSRLEATEPSRGAQPEPASPSQPAASNPSTSARWAWRGGRSARPPSDVFLGRSAGKETREGISTQSIDDGYRETGRDGQGSTA